MKLNYEKYLNEYNHSRPIISSHLEQQYRKEFFYDETKRFGIMYTDFDFHFIFGEIPDDFEYLTNVISRYIVKNRKDIFILYAPNKHWYKLLDRVFNNINGKKKIRNSYKLNTDLFKEYDPKNSFVRMEFFNENSSKIKYPQANTYIKDNLVSYCRGFMIGNNKVELDVWTHEDYRLQGFAFDGCLTIIDYLLEKDLEPIWTCWSYKESNVNLAEKLGFMLDQSYNAYIWKK